MSTTTALKIALTFVNGMAGLVAAFPGSELGVMERLLAAAVVAGCGPALLLLDPPGRSKRLDLDNLTVGQRRKLVAAVKAEMLATPTPHHPPMPIAPRSPRGD